VKLEGHPSWINCVTFSPDGKRLASASNDKTAKVWDLATGERLVTFDKHQSIVGCVRFSPDGLLVASSDQDDPVRVWEAMTGREIATLTGLHGGPRDWFVQFSPEGRWIYSAKEGTLKAWETPPVPGRAAGGEGHSVGTPFTISNSIGMKLVLIPAGEFLMGSPGEGHSGEQPQHPVRIGRSFYLGAYEVTQRQFLTEMGYNPSWFSSDGGGASRLSGRSTERHPIENVSWLEAVAFCNKLSENEGLKPFYLVDGETPRVIDWAGPGYRLPTQAEWEYACRGGSRTQYSYGDEAAGLGRYAWYLQNAGGRSHPVGEKAPNGFGLFDMHGNVWEWCWDWSDEGYYAHSPREDPAGPEVGTLRVTRGGSWKAGAGPQNCRSASFAGGAPGYRIDDLGFRVARNVFAGKMSPSETAVHEKNELHSGREIPRALVKNQQFAKRGARPSDSSYPADAMAFLGKHYKVFPRQLGWHAAKSRCEQMGGHLAVVTSDAQNRFLTDLVRSGGLDSSWLGATDERIEGRWVWVDGTPMRYSNWNSVGHQPKNKQGLEHYLLLWVAHEGKWSDQPDNSSEHKPGFVCQWD
jgi:formylglycine-generating enzyme required for sulfatase activity